MLEEVLLNAFMQQKRQQMKDIMLHKLLSEKGGTVTITKAEIDAVTEDEEFDYFIAVNGDPESETITYIASREPKKQEIDEDVANG